MVTVEETLLKDWGGVSQQEEKALLMEREEEAGLRMEPCHECGTASPMVLLKPKLCGCRVTEGSEPGIGFYFEVTGEPFGVDLGV